MASDIDFGLDCSTFIGGITSPDLDPNFTLITGTLAVAETLARGLIMPRGRLVDVGDVQNSGFDLRRFVSARITPLMLVQIKAGCEQEALLDERVLTATATVTFDAAASRVSVEIHGTTNVGPFTLALAVSKLTTELLKAA